MPVVTKEQLKIWFSNFKKPPEGEFWAWLDSFRHILDKVPLDDVDGLKVVLSKKADLVNGVVPESQLPFSVVTSEVITLGLVELIGNKTYLRVHSSGANKVRVKGKLITRTFQNQWTITPIVAGGVKVLRGYAVKNNDDFLLAEGAELPTYVEPEIPEDALEIFKITMRSSGNVIEETETGLKYITEDGWRKILLTEDLTVLPYNFGLKSSYYITSEVSNPVIGGIRNMVIDKNASPYWDGKEWFIFNATGGDLVLNSVDVTAPDVFLLSEKLQPFTLKNNSGLKLKLRGDELEILPSGGFSLPETGNNTDVLVKDSTAEGGAKWSNRLTLAESNIISESATRLANDNAEIVERAAQDAILNAKINTEIGNRTSADDYLLSQIVADAVRILALENKGYELTDQIVVNSNMTAQESWKGKVVFFTATCTITIPATLSTNYSFNGITVAGVSLTWAITSPKKWANGTPATTIQNQIFNLIQRGSSDDIYLLGLI